MPVPASDPTSPAAAARPGQVVLSRYRGEIDMISIAGYAVHALVWPADPRTGRGRIVLLDELMMVDLAAVEVPITAEMTPSRQLLFAEGVLRAYVHSGATEAAPRPDPAVDEKGEWRICALHRDAKLTQDCTDTPATGLGDIDAAAWAHYVADCDAAGIPPHPSWDQLVPEARDRCRATASRVISAYHGTREVVW